MQDEKLRRITHLALTASVVLIATMFLKVPTPTGYVHLGDGVIYGAAIAFGPTFAAISGGIGSSLADVLGGYFNWWPWTLVIKAVAGWLVGKFGYRKPRSIQAMAMGLGGLWTIVAYALVVSFMYSPKAVAGEVLGNFVQVGSGIIVGIILGPALRQALSDDR